MRYKVSWTTNSKRYADNLERVVHHKRQELLSQAQALAQENTYIVHLLRDESRKYIANNTTTIYIISTLCITDTKHPVGSELISINKN